LCNNASFWSLTQVSNKTMVSQALSVPATPTFTFASHRRIPSQLAFSHRFIFISITHFIFHNFYFLSIYYKFFLNLENWIAEIPPRYLLPCKAPMVVLLKSVISKFIQFSLYTICNFIVSLISDIKPILFNFDPNEWVFVLKWQILVFVSDWSWKKHISISIAWIM